MRVNGTPAPQGSKRHVGGGRLIEVSKRVGPWRQAIVQEAERRGLDLDPIDEPVRVRIMFMLDRPKSHYTSKGELRSTAPMWPAKTPDLDKLVRSTLDGLTQAAVITDDSRVVELVALKVFDTTPGAVIQISKPTKELE